MAIKKEIKIKYNINDIAASDLTVNGHDITKLVRIVDIRFGVNAVPIITIELIATDVDLTLLGFELEVT